jgi:hypothetical protein
MKRRNWVSSPGTLPVKFAVNRSSGVPWKTTLRTTTPMEKQITKSVIYV